MAPNDLGLLCDTAFSPVGWHWYMGMLLGAVEEGLLRVAATLTRALLKGTILLPMLLRRLSTALL
jgi:hypothetical protein